MHGVGAEKTDLDPWSAGRDVDLDFDLDLDCCGLVLALLLSLRYCRTEKVRFISGLGLGMAVGCRSGRVDLNILASTSDTISELSPTAYISLDVWTHAKSRYDRFNILSSEIRSFSKDSVACAANGVLLKSDCVMSRPLRSEWSARRLA